MTLVKELLSIDDVLSRLAGAREAAAVADNVKEASRIDTQWQDIDEQLQRLRARISDREMIEYELASHEMKEHP